MSLNHVHLSTDLLTPFETSSPRSGHIPRHAPLRRPEVGYRLGGEAQGPRGGEDQARWRLPETRNRWRGGVEGHGGADGMAVRARGKLIA